MILITCPCTKDDPRWSCSKNGILFDRILGGSLIFIMLIVFIIIKIDEYRLHGPKKTRR